MSVELLREAAALIQKNAESARDSYARAGDNSDHTIALLDVQNAIAGHPPFGDHIASWSPTVAFAVATLLDNEANAMAAHDRGDPVPGYNNARRTLLTAIATAYLGCDS